MTGLRGHNQRANFRVQRNLEHSYVDRPDHHYLAEDHPPTAEHFERLLRLLHAERGRVMAALELHAALHLGVGTDHAAVVCATCHTSHPCATRRALTESEPE